MNNKLFLIPRFAKKISQGVVHYKICNVLNWLIGLRLRELVHTCFYILAKLFQLKKNIHFHTCSLLNLQGKLKVYKQIFVNTTSNVDIETLYF